VSFEPFCRRVEPASGSSLEECAGAALFVATAGSAYTTDVDVAVDGGYLAF
jgi:hypothetical protein